jgi:hypothetical protein
LGEDVSRTSPVATPTPAPTVETPATPTPATPTPGPATPTPTPPQATPSPPQPPSTDPGCAEDWERVRGVTFGDGSGHDNDMQVYYRNTVTGETSWELPDALRSSVEEVIGEGVEWDGMNGRDEDFADEVLGITKILSEARATSLLATQPLRRLCELSQTCGREEEWVELIEGGRGGDFALVSGVARVVDAGVMSGKREAGDKGDVYYCEAFSFAVRNLILFSKLHPGMWKAIAKESVALMLGNVCQALAESTANLGPDDVTGINGYADFSADEECTVNLMLLREMFLHLPEGSFGGQEAVGQTVSVVLGCLKVASEELFVCAGQTMVEINNREDAVIDEASNQNIIMRDFCSSDGVATSSLIEVCLLLLNENR